MQLALGGRHASIIARNLRRGPAKLLHSRASQLLSSGASGGLQQTHVLSESQAWNHCVRTGTLNNGKTGPAFGKGYVTSALETGPHTRGTLAGQKGVRLNSSYERNGSEEVEEEGTLRRETRSRDSFGQAPEKGKLLTTPSRLLKLLIPLPTDHPKDVETIAILIHSQQPLSYLERLIQAELSPLTDDEGCERRPGVSFIAFQYENHPIRPRKARSKKTKASVDPSKEMEVEEVAVADDKGRGHPEETDPPDEELDTYSTIQQAEPNGHDAEQRYVRWSHATEIGDFIRDAARAGEFIVAVEGAPSGLDQIRITVPSFDERTHYLRMRLRKLSDRIRNIAEIKHECDKLAHRGAQRVALGGFGVLVFWWGLVYELTFQTSLGWDTMEPITYLASLSTLMGGYLWFLYHNREISYRSALDFTINARQKKLYQLKGVDLQLWENLIFEGNSLHREIKTIASEYDAEWDEKLDERDERVIKALKEERNQRKEDEEEPAKGKKRSDD
ncbi:hypothetical protein BDV12DRAFT_113332 [Aspergillus spectabilis]